MLRVANLQNLESAIDPDLPIAVLDSSILGRFGIPLKIGGRSIRSKPNKPRGLLSILHDGNVQITLVIPSATYAQLISTISGRSGRQDHRFSEAHASSGVVNFINYLETSKSDFLRFDQGINTKRELTAKRVKSILSSRKYDEAQKGIMHSILDYLPQETGNSKNRALSMQHRVQLKQRRLLETEMYLSALLDLGQIFPKVEIIAVSEKLASDRCDATRKHLTEYYFNVMNSRRFVNYLMSKCVY
jgi:hypothetical protein